MNEQLKPCPFCGESAIIHREYPEFGSPEDYHSLYTPQCLTFDCIELKDFESEEEAIKAWNTRNQRKEIK